MMRRSYQDTTDQMDPDPNGSIPIFILVSSFLKWIYQGKKSQVDPDPCGSIINDIELRKVLYNLKFNLFNTVNILLYKTYLQSKYNKSFLFNFSLFSFYQFLDQSLKIINNQRWIHKDPDPHGHAMGGISP